MKVLMHVPPVYQNVTPSIPSQGTLVLCYLLGLILHMHSDRAQEPGKAETHTRMS